MGLSRDDVIWVLKLINESAFDEIQLSVGGLNLSAVRGGGEISKLPVIAQTIQPSPPGADAGRALKPPEPGIETDLTTPAASGFLEIRAPSLGVFYVAPEPGAPPYVCEGTVVSEIDTVCLIEVMKLFTVVKAGLAGRIEKVCAHDGQLVEHGQLLFLISPLAQQEPTP